MTENSDSPVNPLRRSAPVSRRTLLGGLGASALTLGLAACAPGTGSTTSSTANTPATTPAGDAGGSMTVPSTGGAGSATSVVEEPLSGKVSFWTINLKAGFEDYINGMIKAFEGEHPGVRIDWVDVPGDQIDAKFLAAVASSDVPDAVNMWNDSISGVAGKLTDFSTVLSAAQLADYQPGLLEPFKIDGKQVAVPWYHGGAPIMIYRKSMLAKVTGFDAGKPPATYDTMLEVAQQVYDATGVYGTSMIPTDQIMSYYGVPMISEDKTKAAFATPEGAAVFEAFKKCYTDKGLAPGSVSNEGVPPQYIDNGKVAFVVNYPSWLANIKKNSPQIYSDIDIAPAPMTKDGKYLLAEIQTLVVPSASKNPKAGAAFIKFITDAENQLAFCKLVPIFPSSIEAGKDPFFTAATDQSLDTKAKLLIGKSLPQLQYIQFGTTHDSELGKVFQQGARDYLSGSSSATAALSGIADKWNTILAG